MLLVVATRILDLGAKMKRLFSTFVAVFFLVTAGTGTAEARGVIVYNWGGISVDLVEDLPDTETFNSVNGHMNLGWAQKEYSLFWAPFWKSKGLGYILYVEKNDNIYYRKLGPAQLAVLSQITGKTYPREHAVGLFSRTWGWLVALGLIFVIAIKGKAKKE